MTLGPTSVDGTYTLLPGVTFVSGVDFPASHLILSVSVSITFKKTGGNNCNSNSNSYSYNNEIYFGLNNPSGTLFFLNPGVYSGGTPTGNVTTVFNSAAAGIASGTPVSGSFMPPSASFAGYIGTSPFGLWRLGAGDTAGQDPLCVYTYSITITTYDPLPIELLYFFGTPNEKERRIDLNWATSSEINNDYFDIEKSKNGLEWEKIAKVQGAGNSTSMLTYETKDEYPIIGLSYYRLTQTDFNGESKIFPIESVMYQFPDFTIKEEGNELKLFGEFSDLKLYNSIGQLMPFVTSSPNSQTYSNLSAGVYLVRYTFKGMPKEYKFQYSNNH